MLARAVPNQPVKRSAAAATTGVSTHNGKRWALFLHERGERSAQVARGGRRVPAVRRRRERRASQAQGAADARQSSAARRNARRRHRRSRSIHPSIDKKDGSIFLEKNQVRGSMRRPFFRRAGGVWRASQAHTRVRRGEGREGGKRRGAVTARERARAGDKAKGCPPAPTPAPPHTSLRVNHTHKQRYSHKATCAFATTAPPATQTPSSRVPRSRTSQVCFCFFSSTCLLLRHAPRFRSAQRVSCRAGRGRRGARVLPSRPQRARRARAAEKARADERNARRGLVTPTPLFRFLPVPRPRAPPRGLFCGRARVPMDCRRGRRRGACLRGRL